MTKRQKYILTTKLIKIMKKILSLSMMAAMVLAMILLCLPCFLIFSQGSDGELTVWNFVGRGGLDLYVGDGFEEGVVKMPKGTKDMVTLDRETRDAIAMAVEKAVGEGGGSQDGDVRRGVADG